MPSTETNLTIAVIVLGVALFVSICFNCYLLIQLNWRSETVPSHSPKRKRKELDSDHIYSVTREESTIAFIQGQDQDQDMEV